jgi:GntR family transcriptional regulator
VEDIRSREPGERLPTEQELIDSFRVSRTTIRAAMEDLERAGMISRQAGRGTFVTELPIEQELTRLTGFVEDMNALNLRATARVIMTRETTSDTHVSSRLQVPEGSKVMQIERVRLAEGQPLSFDVTFLPLEIGEKVVSDNLQVYPIFELLETKYGIALGESDYRITARNANARIARHLNMRAGGPILHIERTTLAKSGKPIDHEELHYRGDRIRYLLRLKR